MSEPKKSAWDDYRKWQKLSWTPLLAAFGVFFFPSIWPVLPIVFSFGIYCAFRIRYFDCPKCDEPFFINPRFFRFYWPWSGTCMNCGFPKWEEPPPKPPKANTPPVLTDKNPNHDPAVAKNLQLLKFLTLVLRDDPGALGLHLHADGWAEVQNLLTRANRYDFKLTREDLAAVIDDPEEHSFEWDPSGDRIRVAIDGSGSSEAIGKS